MAKAAPSTAPAPAPAAASPTPPAGAAERPAAAASGGGMKAWLPAIAVVVLAPVCTWAVCQFVLIPQLQAQLSATPAAAEASSEGGHGGSHGGGHGEEAKDAAPNYEFQNVVVNLAGTMGTRYLKTSFLVTGAEPNIKSLFEANKPRLTDVTLNVLSSLSLSDLEEPGAKNVLREKLVAAYNQALGKKVAEQVYFSDFVVQ
ncbi:MAG TPA: flagellar basal body-associated FliL family protein [Opitutus sp.]|nr:flagellar basal body-associated FliL family protein [Opitutus sp.]